MRLFATTVLAALALAAPASASGWHSFTLYNAVTKMMEGSVSCP